MLSQNSLVFGFGLAPVVLAMAISVVIPGHAQADSDDSYEYDPENAQEVMDLCAGCHGEHGQGGGGGEYPRLAGLPKKYLVNQMRAFQSGEREGIVMAPYADERELSTVDMLDITTYLAQIDLPTTMPVIDPDLDSYEKLLIASRVFNVPRLEGDAAAGESIYNRRCKLCHGKAGVGRGATPPLAGQHSDYLRLQIAAFRGGRRVNQKMEKYLQPLTDLDIENLLAYLSLADD